MSIATTDDASQLVVTVAAEISSYATIRIPASTNLDDFTVLKQFAMDAIHLRKLDPDRSSATNTRIVSVEGTDGGVLAQDIEIEPSYGEHELRQFLNGTMTFKELVAGATATGLIRSTPLSTIRASLKRILNSVF